MRKRYNIKKTISMKQFISEFGDSFSDHMKKRLLDLEVRTVLKRTEDINILDLAHVEHPKYNLGKSEKEYLYAQFLVEGGILYFSEKCTENNKALTSPIVKTIYDNLDSKGMISTVDNNAKKVDDSNIDYVIDSILSVCPPVSQQYLDIVKGMIARAEK